MSIRRLMLKDSSVRSSPSTLYSFSMMPRSLIPASSLRLFTRVSELMPAFWQIAAAVFGPMPKMYVKATTTRFSFGMSTPEIRMFLLLTLALLVALVLANHAQHALAPDELAIRTNFLDRSSDFHGNPLLVPICIDTRSGPWWGRTPKSPA